MQTGVLEEHGVPANTEVQAEHAPSESMILAINSVTGNNGDLLTEAISSRKEEEAVEFVVQLIKGHVIDPLQVRFSSRLLLYILGSSCFTRVIARGHQRKHAGALYAVNGVWVGNKWGGIVPVPCLSQHYLRDAPLVPLA